jgi:hypothetical protein
MTLRELFYTVGLTDDSTKDVIADIKLHNFQFPKNQLPEIDLTQSINMLPVSVLPKIGRALAMDLGTTKDTVVFDQDAMKFAMDKIMPFYLTEKKEKEQKDLTESEEANNAEAPAG